MHLKYRNRWNVAIVWRKNGNDKKMVKTTHTHTHVYTFDESSLAWKYTNYNNKWIWIEMWINKKTEVSTSIKASTRYSGFWFIANIFSLFLYLSVDSHWQSGDIVFRSLLSFFFHIKSLVVHFSRTHQPIYAWNKCNVFEQSYKKLRACSYNFGSMQTKDL